jgi:hypothetical protein
MILSGPIPINWERGVLDDFWLYATIGGGDAMDGRRDSGTAGFWRVAATGMFSGAKGERPSRLDLATTHEIVYLGNGRSEPPIPKS